MSNNILAGIQARAAAAAAKKEATASVASTDLQLMKAAMTKTQGNPSTKDYSEQVKTVLQVALQYSTAKKHSTAKNSAIKAIVSDNADDLINAGYVPVFSQLDENIPFSGLAVLGFPYAVTIEKGVASFTKAGRSEFVAVINNGGSNTLTDNLCHGKKIDNLVPDMMVLGNLDQKGEFKDLFLKKPYNPADNQDLEVAFSVLFQPDDLYVMAETVAKENGWVKDGRYQSYALMVGFVSDMYLKAPADTKNEAGETKYKYSMFSVTMPNWIMFSRPLSWINDNGLNADCLNKLRISVGHQNTPAPTHIPSVPKMFGSLEATPLETAAPAVVMEIGQQTASTSTAIKTRTRVAVAPVAQVDDEDDDDNEQTAAPAIKVSTAKTKIDATEKKFTSTNTKSIKDRLSTLSNKATATKTAPAVTAEPEYNDSDFEESGVYGYVDDEIEIF